MQLIKKVYGHKVDEKGLLVPKGEDNIFWSPANPKDVEMAKVMVTHPMVALLFTLPTHRL